MKLLVTDPIAQEGIALLQQHAQVEIRLGATPQELLSLIGEYDGLIVRSETKVTAPVIEAGNRLRVIARAGVGVDNIDVEAATRQGIVVVNAPTGNTVSAAELTLGLMLAMARNIPQAHALLKAGEWRRQDLVGVEVRNKVLGILGLGRVGSEVARRAQALEMHVIAHDPFIAAEHARLLGIELVPLEQLLRTADFITIHTPLTSTTQSFVGAKELSLMKPSARIINTARGGIIDEEALFRALEESRIAGAALDVFAQEPPQDSPLLSSDRVIVTPHLGASTEEAQTNVALDVAREVLAVLQGQPARYAVNTPFLSSETMSVLYPFLDVATILGNLVTQLAEGQPGTIRIHYEGEIANYDVAPLKAAVLGGMLAPISEERVTLVNAHLVAASRGLRIEEHKGPDHGTFSNLITVEATTSAGTTVVAGTLMRGQPHIVQVNGYWLDIVPTGGYLLFCENQDRPGTIGKVGTLLGDADINIAFMQVGRDHPRGKALMALGLDESIQEAHREQILAIPGIYSVKQVTL